VILADSGSTDGTIEKAMKFPITIVQLTNPTERCCGIGPQLGYQHSHGEYVQILDGDMEPDPSFVSRGIELLDRDSSIGGVGGILTEMRIQNLEFQGRAKRALRRSPKTPDVNWLSTGALYRRAALEQTGYFSDRNLHGYEEYDLGARLRAIGWRLVHLETHAINHYGHTMNTFRLLWHRIRTGYVLSAGEVLHAAIKSGYLTNVLRELQGLRVALGVWVYSSVVALIFFRIPDTRWAIAFLVIALLLPPAAMMLRTGSLKLAAFSVLLWYVNAVALIFGLFRKRTSPTKRIDSRVLRTVPENICVAPQV
jgi:cellulose synthase/poly-beta-1,6-N-acetylglucosamine synthase-like glycosyltransferase